MSEVTVGLGSSARRLASPVALVREARRAWLGCSVRTRVAIQLSIVLLAVVGAYNYSLLTLLQNVGLETPLAYVSLVPAIALALAAVRSKPTRPEPQIHDRQVDYIVGLPLMGLALWINLALPNKFSVMFWVWRLDLLSLPLFVAGTVAIVFGTRVLWRQKLAVLYLVLAWPLPWSAFLLGVLNAFTNLTLAALHSLVGVLHVATVLPGDGSIFNVVHHGVSFPLSVISACSGVNGVVGFVLVGSAFWAIVNGNNLRKLLWLAVGMVIIWAMNLFRLLFIFWAGKTWGEHVAISILHPFVGLLTFGVGVVVMMLLMRPFGMTIATPEHAPVVPPASSPGGGEPGAQSALRGLPAHRDSVAVPRVFLATIIVAGAAVALSVADSGLRVYNLVANSSGEPTLTALTGADSRVAAPPGWTGSYEAQFDWAKPYFGDDSTWYRYAYVAAPGAPVYSSIPVTVDVINTTDLDSFSAYGIIACYTFHGYQLQDVADVNLGGGITGQTLSYTAGSNGSWTIVYWIVPVKNGNQTHYERVVVYLINGVGGTIRYPASTPGVHNLSGSLNGVTSPQTRLLQRNRNFVVAFAQSLIRSQARATPRLTAATHLNATALQAG